MSEVDPVLEQELERFCTQAVFGFHPEEFLRLLREGNPFVLDIMHDGIVVYEDGFMQRAQAAYREAIQRYGLRRVRGGWDWEIGTRHR